ncbi:hypothetical protein ACFYXQ_16595 [Nocardia jiangxiensis]|uniref:Uncharacterized protein n=1 Tax=Nocardia jiangxiensis TaxID=282685 RepID=A0ABW6RZD2_9NOCA
MWEWSRTVTERAVAASRSGWLHRESRPTVVDPEPWARADVEQDERSGDHRDDDMLAGISGANAYCLAG